MAYLTGLSFKVLEGETIKSITHGSDMTPKCGPYGAWTIQTESGKELVIWNHMGENNVSQVTRSKDN